MEIKEMITLIKQEKTLNEINLKNRKNNINSNYMLAKHDFRIIDKLKDCQERIIERDRISITDL